MLAHILALAVGLVSFALYMSAFFFPEAYRKSDLTWSGIGLFYALVLWVCAGRITGGVLLGQTASVALLGWLGWQTINLRRELAPSALRTPLPGETKTIVQAVQFKLGELRSRWRETGLARQTNRLTGTIAGWTGGISRSVAKPKKQPPAVGGRLPRKAPRTASAPSPTSESVEAATPIVSETVTSEPPVASEPAVSESVVSEAAALEPPAAQPVRPARPSRNLFGGFRRGAAKSKSAKQRSVPPAPASIDELEDWEEEEVVEAAAIETPDTPAIEDVVIVVETEELENWEDEEATDAPAGTETPAIDDVVVVVEMDSPSVVEVIEVEVIEAVAPEDEAIAPEAKAAIEAVIEVEPDESDLPPDAASSPDAESIDPPSTPAGETASPTESSEPPAAQA